MSGNRPDRVVDPVCGMTVDTQAAEAAGLTAEFEGRTYAFCQSGCKRAFDEEPATYASIDRGAADGSGGSGVEGPGVAALGALPVIDEGMRRWYESCSCCLSDTYPEIKAALDAERAAAAQAPVGAGICEVADAADPVQPATV